MQDHVHGGAGLLVLIGIRALSAVSLGLVQIGDFGREGPLCLLDKNTVIFTDNSADLTKGVLEQLNANDPSKASAPSPSKAPKK